MTPDTLRIKRWRQLKRLETKIKHEIPLDTYEYMTVMYNKNYFNENVRSKAYEQKYKSYA